MSLIEKWFQRGFDLAGKLHAYGKADAAALDLEQDQRRLTVLFRLLSAEAVNLNLSKASDIWINDLTVSLPRIFGPTKDFADNKTLLLYAVAMISMRIQLAASKVKDEPNIKNLEGLLLREFPSFQGIIADVDRISENQPNIRDFLFAKRAAHSGVITLLNPQDQERNNAPPGSTTIATAPQVTTVVLDESEENPLLHSFEKIHTAEEYQSGNKQLKDADDLAMEQRALEELLFSRVIRTNQTAKSYAQTDVLLDKNQSPLDEAVTRAPDVFLYPEWSYRHARHRENWCQVIEDRSTGIADEFILSDKARAEATNLQRFLAGMLNLRRWKRGYCEGPEIDLDAVIRHYATPEEHRDSNSRLFQRRQWASNDLAILILIDVSLSSDSWVDDKRLLDLEKDFMAILATALTGTTMTIEIAGFCSETRKCCNYLLLKDFSQNWSGVLGKISSLKPHGYTRLGPILRHGSKRLSEVPAKNRAIFALTDARPTDYDAYEGLYGISDVQKAIQEARNMNIHTVGFIMGNKREKYHQQIFGRGGYHYTMDTTSFLTYFRRLFVGLIRR